MVNLRKDEDADIIEFMEANKDRIGPTDVFRKGYEKLKNEGF